MKKDIEVPRNAREDWFIGRIAELEFALTIARQALLYHTAQTRPIDDTSVALATINAALKGGE